MKWARLAVAATLASALTSPILSRAQPGSLDITFNPGTGVGTYVGQAGVGVWALALRADGRIMVGGFFNSVNGQARNAVARLYSDGSLDTSFVVLQGPTSYSSVFAVELEPDGKVYVGGSFSDYNNIGRSRFARLRDDGSLDMDWPNISFNNTVRSIKRMSDGSVLVLGDFTQVNGTARMNVAKLNANASLDMDFNPGAGVTDGTITAAALEPGGKVIIAGSFKPAGQVARPYVSRVYPDGTLDSTFDAGYIGGVDIRCVALQPDGKVVIGGFFTSVNGGSHIGIARLGTNGLVEPGFVLPSGYQNVVSIIGLTSDNRILAGGQFWTANSDRWSVIFDGDGNYISAFPPQINGQVKAFAVQPDGKVLIGGDFTTVNGTNISRIARLNGDPSPPTDLQFMAANMYFGTYLYGTVSNTYRVEWTSKSDTPSLWTPLFNVTLQTNPQFILDPTPAAGTRFYRAIQLPP